MYIPDPEDWLTREDCWQNLLDNYASAKNYRAAAETYIWSALDYWDEGNLSAAIYDLCVGVLYHNNALSYLVMYNPYFAPSYGILYWINQHADVTYQSICEAWGRNDFEGRAPTIAFIDRMRQLLWDEPYSAVFAAKPEDEEL